MVKQNPFSLYDFLGYFIPGALFLYLIFIINSLKIEKTDILNTLKSENDFQIDKVLFLVIISYAVGHLINFISSITIEKYSIWKYGYPSKFLLEFEIEKYWKKNDFTGYLLRIIMLIILFPVTFFDFLIGECLNFKNVYTRKLDEFLIQIIREKGNVLINNLFKNKEGKFTGKTLREFDFYRLFAHYTFENTKNHQVKLINYVVLYGFLRTLTLISVLIFWYLIYSILIDKNNNINLIQLLFVSIISYVFFMAFMKFYRRYTLEGLMLIAIDKELVYSKSK